MAISKSLPIRFTPRGLTDAFDSTDKFPGAFQYGANLIFDSANPELVIPRPGVVTLADLAVAGIVSPAFISVQVSIGSRVFGMVASSLNPGKDQPFVYDVSTGALVAVSGITNANSPTSPSTSGEWEPPTIANVGVYVIVTHPGFTGIGSDYFGTFDLTNPAAPVWSSLNTATNGLTARPSAVANFNNRAYFAVANQVQYTDVLIMERTNADQALVVGDLSDITALSGLPVQTTSSGVIGAMIVWKVSSTWQVTGDKVTTNLALNYLSLSVGTSFPRSVAQSTLGTYFLSSGGPYFVDPLGTLRTLTNRLDSLEPDIVTPFVNAITPSRWAGAYASSIYRVCGQTTIRGQTQTVDYWFDERKRRWTGPHSFAYDCASAMNGSFVLTGAGTPGILVDSDPSPTPGVVYEDLGAGFDIWLITSSFPKIGEMAIKQVAESQIELGNAATATTYTIEAQDEGGVPIDTVTITTQASGIYLWGGTTWGGGLWSSGEARPPLTYAVPWTAPLVFEKMQISVRAAASQNVQIGTFFARYQKTGYMTIREGI